MRKIFYNKNQKKINHQNHKFKRTIMFYKNKIQAYKYKFKNNKKKINK